MTTAQKIFLTIGIFIQALLVVDLWGIQFVEEPYIKNESRQYGSRFYYEEEEHTRQYVQTPLGLLTRKSLTHHNAKNDIQELFNWYSGINAVVTLVMLAIWRRKKTADA